MLGKVKLACHDRSPRLRSIFSDDFLDNILQDNLLDCIALDKIRVRHLALKIASRL